MISLLFSFEENFLYFRINVDNQNIIVLVCSNELTRNKLIFFTDIYFSLLIELREKNHNNRAKPSLICTWTYNNKKADKLKETNILNFFKLILKLLIT